MRQCTPDAEATDSCGYDAAGTTTLSYDYESRITGITYPGGATNSFAYNGLDTRVSKTDSGGTATFKRDGAYVTDPVLTDGSAAYTPGLAERRSGATTYSHSGLKSHDRQSTTSQTVSATRQYDAFGNLTSTTGTWKGPFGYAGPFGYQEDGDSGLKLLGHRYYDASTGRFLSRDSAMDGRNWYAYCENSPLGSVDNSGLEGWEFKFIIRQIKEVVYHVIKGGDWKDVEKHARSLGDDVIEHGGHKGRPPHLHPVKNGNKVDIHVISEDLADAATGDEWVHWRDNGKPLALFIAVDDPNIVQQVVDAVDPTPVGWGKMLADALISLVDPLVERAQGERQQNADYWLSE